MENSMEEAIERLEYIDRAYSCNNYYSVWDLKCIEILLSEYKKLQKENEELKNNGVIDENEFELAVDCDYDRLKRLIDTADKSEEFILYNNEKWIKEKYSVSIEKIKEKIEDLKMLGGSDGKDNTENTARELAIEALQNILEESEENNEE